MSLRSKSLVQYGLVLMAGAAMVGCGSGGDVGTDPDPVPASIHVFLSQAFGTVRQGGSQTLTATLNRGGGFTGPVSFAVSGQPTGVTTEVSHEHTSGTVTIATVTLSVGMTTLPSTYRLTLHAVGSGVTEATAGFTLSVTLADQGGFKLTLSSPALSIVQGAATPTTTVNVVRNNFTGPVVLGVDEGDCHGTMPPGITGTFAPNPATGNSAVLTLKVDASTAPALYYLQVNAYTPSGVLELAPLTLTVVAAGSGLRAVVVPGQRRPSHCGAPQP